MNSTSGISMWLMALATGAMLVTAGAARGAEEEQKTVKKKVKVVKGCCGKGSGWTGAKKKRGFLGVHLTELTEELRTHFGAPKDAGVMVGQVMPGTPAQKAGMRVGDVLTEVDGEKVESTWGVVRAIGKKKQGEKARLKIVRQGKVQTLTAVIEERERPQVEVSKLVQTLPGGHKAIQIAIDAEDLGDQVECFREQIEDFAVDPTIFETIHLEEGKLEKRIKEMEEKIRKLEEKLQGRVTKGKGKRST